LGRRGNGGNEKYSRDQKKNCLVMAMSLELMHMPQTEAHEKQNFLL